MLRRALTWDPSPLVTVPLLFGITSAVSLAMTGTVEPMAVVLAGVCSGAYVGGRRRRQRAAATPAQPST